MGKWMLSGLAMVGVLAVVATMGQTQEKGSPVKIIIKDGKVVAEEPTLPLDPVQRIVIGHTGPIYFGLTVEGKRISCSPEGSIWSSARIDNQVMDMGPQNGPAPGVIPADASGKKRLGTQASFRLGPFNVVQTLEVIPSKPAVKGAPGQKRKLDTVRVTYLVENLAPQPHTLEWRVGIDMLIANNDGALYASPTTHPGKVLNGVQLKGKELPDYVHALERPDVTNPGFVATLTLKKAGKGEGPEQIVLTNLGALGNGNWEVPAQPAGDSACALFWGPKKINPGEKREMVWAYGGGIATSPDSEGNLSLALGGSLEPGKLFSITAQVDDPLPSQTLTLDLPAGMVRMEGKEIQPVPPPGETGSSIVLWKARVQQMGDFEVKVRSSTGVTQIKHISIRPAQ